MKILNNLIAGLMALLMSFATFIGLLVLAGNVSPVVPLVVAMCVFSYLYRRLRLIGPSLTAPLLMALITLLTILITLL